MQPGFYKIATIGEGFLATMARPRAGEWVSEEFRGFADAGIRRIISLLEDHESRELGLSEEARFCEEAGIGYLTFPLPDRSVPANVDDVRKVSHNIFQRCSDGESTAIHCRAGIGRSSLIAATVLLYSGLNVDQALADISAARGLPVPDTEEQWNWLLDYEAQHHSSR